MQCTEFGTLLSDALDQMLTGAKLESFQSHRRVCPTCGPMFAEAEAGERWLKSLEEVNPPANLVHSILASTTGINTARLRTAPAYAPDVQPSPDAIAAVAAGKNPRVGRYLP